MTNCKRTGIFLLLGVMLVGLLICGCTPAQQTEDTTGAPEPDANPNAVAFRDLPDVNMDNISEINIYIGDNDSKPVQTISTAEEISNFRVTFENLRFTSYASTSSFSYDICAFEEAIRCIEAETTYRIEVKSDDGANWDIYVAENKQVYYTPFFAIVYVSTAETEYIDALGIDSVLNRSYIEGCTYAGVTKSLTDSATHTLFGEENVTAFFDTFFAGLVLTDNGARIKQVQANSDRSGFPFQICFTCNENTSLLVCFYENGAITVNYGDDIFASVQDNVVDKQAVEHWLKEHDAL